MKTTTVRMNDNTLGRIDGLATTLSRSRSWIINQAIERFIDYEELKKKRAKMPLELSATSNPSGQGRIAMGSPSPNGICSSGKEASLKNKSPPMIIGIRETLYRLFSWRANKQR